MFLKAISENTSRLARFYVLTLQTYSSRSFQNHKRTGGEATEHCNLIMVYHV